MYVYPTILVYDDKTSGVLFYYLDSLPVVTNNFGDPLVDYSFKYFYLVQPLWTWVTRRIVYLCTLRVTIHCLSCVVVGTR